MKGFVKLKAKSATGVFETLIALDHIGTVLESTRGSQIVCKNGDIVPLKDDFKTVEKAIEEALGELDGTPRF